MNRDQYYLAAGILIGSLVGGALEHFAGHHMTIAPHGFRYQILPDTESGEFMWDYAGAGSVTISDNSRATLLRVDDKGNDIYEFLLSTATKKVKITISGASAIGSVHVEPASEPVMTNNGGGFVVCPSGTMPQVNAGYRNGSGNVICTPLNFPAGCSEGQHLVGGLPSYAGGPGMHCGTTPGIKP